MKKQFSQPVSSEINQSRVVPECGPPFDPVEAAPEPLGDDDDGETQLRTTSKECDNTPVPTRTVSIIATS